ncbi:cytochrome P450 [Streptomyces sp. NPDC050560]|uniref:cytochrome P450 n=1 Tax=Streptomyces sp. NPDC050560 TaxID=3365630 RepID=UPI003789B6E7
MDDQHTAPAADAARRCPIYGQDFAADPNGIYDQLRAHGPAAPVEIAPGVDATLVTQHEAALRVMQNPSLFVRDSRRWTALNDGRVPADSPVLGMMAYRPNCLYTDGTEHLRLRKAVTESLDQLNVSRLGRDVERIADYLIDQFSERGSAELMGEYAKLLPLLLFNKLFGCPAGIGDTLTRSISVLFDGGDVVAAHQDLTDCLMELVTIKRREPGEDITSWLVQHPAGLSDEELKDQLIVLMGAGVEPVRNLIGSATFLLLSEDSRQRGGLLVEDALNEVLWNVPPVANWATHFPVQDVDLGGVIIEANTPVLISFAAANRDPALTEARQALGKGAHLSWGAGPHVCPAKSPAQLIAVTAIEKLLNALPDLTLGAPEETLAWRPGPFHRALAELPVRFSPTPATRVAAALPPQTSAPVGASHGSAAASAQAAPKPEQGGRKKGFWSSFLDVFRI